MWCGKLIGKFMCQSVYRNKQTDRHGKARHTLGREGIEALLAAVFVRICVCRCGCVDVCRRVEMRGGAGGKVMYPAWRRDSLGGSGWEAELAHV